MSSSISVRNKMEDIKKSQEELEEVRTSRSKARSNTRHKGFHPKSSRPIIRFKLVDLDFSLKLGDIQDIKTRPLFFSIINKSDTSRRNGRPICNILSKVDCKTTAESGDGDSIIISGDLTTKMLGATVADLLSAAETRQGNTKVARQKDNVEIRFGDGDSKTILRDLETKMPRTLRSSAARNIYRNLVPRDVTTKLQKMEGGTVATYFTPCTLRCSASETLYRNLNPGDAKNRMLGGTVATYLTPCTLKWSAAETLYRIVVPRDVTIKIQKMSSGTGAPYFTPSTLTSSGAGTLYRILNVVRQRGNPGIVDGNIYEWITYGAINMVDKTKAENVISATQIKTTSSGTIPEIEPLHRIKSHRCQDTKDIVDVNTSNSTVPSAMTELQPMSDTTAEQETTRPQKRQNFLKKFWKRITRKSKNRTESKIDEQGKHKNKILKESSKLTSWMCLCQSKTLD